MLRKGQNNFKLMKLKFNNKYNSYIAYTFSFLNLFFFGIGSFLCFIVAVIQGEDRLLIGGTFLLLLTFINQKILHWLFKNND